MTRLFLQEPSQSDESFFLAATQKSQPLHHPWIKSPTTHDEFLLYIKNFQQPNQKSYWLMNSDKNLVGVFNISEIVRGQFQSAYLGFYAMTDFAGQGLMSVGLKKILEQLFTELNLHRVEANIQPDNLCSIYLVQKNGFQKEGYSPRYLKINGEWRDHERWAITLETWLQKN